MTETTETEVLILGASFLGIELLRLLRRSWRGRGLEVALVDRQRVHPYIPLGHELLTARMAYGTGAGTVLETAKYVESQGAEFIEGEITGFERDSHTVTLADGRRVSGRFVVVALGSEIRAPASLPGGEQLHAYKSEADYRRCAAALERVLGPDAEPGQAEPTVLVIGGGISGVEIAGELAHLRAAAPPGWRVPKLVLVHGGERLLPGLTARAGRQAEAALRKQGARVELRTRVQSIEDGVALLRGPGGEERLPCALGFWAGGLQPPPVLAALGLPLTEDGWLHVGPTLQCFSSTTEEPEIFAGGDVARVHGGRGRWPTMQRAIESIFAARTIATNILELNRCTPDYPGEGVPPLQPHPLWTDFAHGVSIGAQSLFVYGPLSLPAAGLNIWFRRFLMRRYMARYRP